MVSNRTLLLFCQRTTLIVQSSSHRLTAIQRSLLINRRPLTKRTWLILFNCWRSSGKTRDLLICKDVLRFFGIRLDSSREASTDSFEFFNLLKSVVINVNETNGFNDTVSELTQLTTNTTENWLNKPINWLTQSWLILIGWAANSF